MSAEQATFADYRDELAASATVAGIEGARIGDADGFDLALGVVRRLAWSREPFTADDVRQEVLIGSPAIGSAFRHAARQGLIEQVGFVSSRTPSRHGAVIRLWRGAP